MFEELLRRWDGEHVVVRHDSKSGVWMIVGVHSTRLGPAMGGTRLKTYASPAEALEDALRLAAGMTRKLAVVGLPCGGGKAVLAVPELPEGNDRRRLFERYAELVDSLGGTFVTGPDVNTGEADMDVIGDRTPHVFCRSVANGGSGDPSVHTALGVFHGIRASLAHALSSDDPAGRTVLVQGAGSVGAKLALLLAEAGANVLVADVDEERARATGAAIVPADAALETECDVYAPCALGATLSAETIPRLRCRIVAGGANNQLATPEDAERLRAAGILYAPDYVINSGGALHGIGLERLGWDADRLEREVAGIGATLTSIYADADAEGSSTDAAAERLAAARLARRRPPGHKRV
ncbi:MAG TPA: Glu/Leu/Phe/Val dehydrogenase dimerization domain-containing protein [Gaiellaceae bacterium]|nr:Glu/Leu/Phe/Val dehydrogenase dimerization domain-containing protein [Gaiellaceae bacterium]